MQKPEDTEEIAEGEYDDVLELLGKDAKHLHRMGLFTGIYSHSVKVITCIAIQLEITIAILGIIANILYVLYVDSNNIIIAN